MPAQVARLAGLMRRDVAFDDSRSTYRAASWATSGETGACGGVSRAFERKKHGHLLLRAVTRGSVVVSELGFAGGAELRRHRILGEHTRFWRTNSTAIAGDGE